MVPRVSWYCLFLLLSVSSLAAFQSTPPPARSFVRTDAPPSTTLFDPTRHVVYAAVPNLGQLLVISTSDHSVVAQIAVPGAFCMDLSPDGSRLVVGSGGNTLGGRSTDFLSLIDTASLQVVDRVPIPIFDNLSPTTAPLSLAWTSNGTILIVAYQFNSTWSQLIQWDPEKGTFRPRSLPNFVFPQALVRSGDHSKVLLNDSSSTGANLVLYDANLDDFTASGRAEGIYPAANSDGSQFAVSGVDQLIILDGALNPLATLHVNFHGAKPLYSADGQFLYSGDGNSYSIFETSTFTVTKQIPAFTTPTGFNNLASLDGIDDHGEVFGCLDRGVVFNAIQSRSIISNLEGLRLPNAMTPSSGKLASPGRATLTGTLLTAGSSVYFGSQPGISTSVTSENTISVTPPAGTDPGPVDVVLETATGGAALAPQGYSYGPTILYLMTNAGPTSGGTPIQIIGYGFDFDASQIQVKIGGQVAPINQVFPYAGISPFVLPIHRLYITSPPGAIGPADITLTTPSGTTTLRNGFRYYSLASATGPTYVGQMVFDRQRNVVYATDFDGNRVDKINPAANQTTPGWATGTGPVGLALTPDGATLLVANQQSQSVSVIDIASGATQTVAVPGSNHPFAIAASNNHKALLGTFDPNMLDNGVLFELDLSTLKLTVANTGLLYLTSDLEVHSFQGGSKIWVGSGSRGGSDSGGALVWDAATDSFVPFRVRGFSQSDITEDGLLLVASGNFYTSQGQATSFVAPLDLIQYPYIAYAEKLHPGGGLLFKPHSLDNHNSAISVYDVHSGTLLRQIGIPGLINVTLDALALDSTGDRIFISTDSGIVTLSLTPLPLTIGTVYPAQGVIGGNTTVTIRGSNFQSGATVAFGGTPAPAIRIDGNTLQVVTPSHAAGPVSVTVTNTDRTSYVLPAAFTYVPAVPAITSSVPTSVTAGTGIFLTIYGDGFLPGASIRWNGVALDTFFVDEQTLQATVAPGTVGDLAGLAQITVFNPGGAVSDAFAVPITLPPGQISTADQYDFGASQVDTSSAQADIPIYNSGDGMLTGLAVSISGDFSQTNNCPATLPPHANCDAMVTFRPSALGTRTGILAVNSNFGSKNVPLTGYGVPPGPALRVLPATPKFFTVFVGLTGWAGVTVYSVGTSPVSISSASASGDFQVFDNSCGTQAVSTSCGITVSFTPTSSGLRTGALSIASNAADSPTIVPLSGIGVQPLVFSPRSLDFGSHLVLSSTTKQIQVQNTSSSITYISSVLATGPYTAKLNCASNIYPGQSCTVDVTFVPNTVGANPGNVVAYLPVAGGNQQLVFPLTGSGTDFQFRPPQGGSTTASVKAGETAQYSLSIANNGYAGTVDLSCTGAPQRSTCSVSPNPIALTGNETQTVNVTVSTQAPSAAMLIPAGSGRNLVAIWMTASCLVGFGLCICFPEVRRRRLLLVGALAASFAMLPSCGGGSSGGPPGGNGGGGGGVIPGTPRGTYTLVVAAQSAGVTHQVQLTLTVQ